MENTDRQRFIGALLMLAETFNQQLSEARAEAYWIALQHLDIEAFEQGCHFALSHAKFFPVPAVLLEYIEGSSEELAEQAWMEYKRLARSYGGYGSPMCSAQLAQTIVGVFGSWENACWQDFSDEMWASKRKEFGRVFQVMRRREPAEKQQRLVGSMERDRINRPEFYQPREHELLAESKRRRELPPADDDDGVTH